ncbi:DarT ssDNA thymidine ADP-ribosyltransferase family protein [Flavobacterium sp. ENC]|uniref:DarT ssDNA thymidine ADP-ribosyltransferase family protein n=1 Tax=Flavobacterium sp. ENC TaxID=2897330 RepID=UPI001E3D5BA0|nr:DarT ssDNA thymidine ADP-ribosyltransferase family protein [Flavobacterium sp. ENC]MCD0466097.1 DarT ssDNA thymidine ADP-ribosyltransferase family protein [Flavobacterium sp. ENC]
MKIPQEHQDKYFYHFTHIDNLDSIVENGFLSTNEKERLGLSHKDVANGNIQERRSNMKVTVGPGGKVHDYVPFYFCTRNPMLLSLVLSKNIDQMFMIFFAIPIKKIVDKEVVFTDASANTISPPNFYFDAIDLDKLNWDVILSQKWMPNEGEKNKKMAEALVYKSLPISDVSTIIAWNPYIKKHIKDTFLKKGVNCPNISFEPFYGKNFFFTKFAMGRGTETFTTGPILLRNKYDKVVENIIKKRSTIVNFRFKNVNDLLLQIDNDFCIIEELEGIYNLPTINEVHNETVSDHTLNVVNNLEEILFFIGAEEEEKDILKLSAYFHDIGKGPHKKWEKGKQLSFPDHPVDSLEMLERILVNEIKILSDDEIKMICFLVAYHDLIGEILGKGRDKMQLFDLIESEKEFDMLNCLNYADVLSFNNNWHTNYEDSISQLKKEFLDKLKK